VVRLLLEATAIFSGVTLGFLADDFRDYRNDRKQEHESLTQVLLDLELDSEDMSPMLPQTEAIAEGTQWISNHAAKGQVPSDSLLMVLDSLSQTPAYSYEASDFAYSGLVNTGRIDLIRDANLRRALVVYFKDRQPIVAAVNAQWRKAYFEWWESAGNHIDFLPDERPDEAWPHVRAADAPALGRDRKFLLRTIAINNWSRTLRKDIEEAFDLSADLAERIRAYLDES